MLEILHIYIITVSKVYGVFWNRDLPLAAMGNSNSNSFYCCESLLDTPPPTNILKGCLLCLVLMSLLGSQWFLWGHYQPKWANFI